MGWEWSSFPPSGASSFLAWSPRDMGLSLWVVQDPEGSTFPGIPTACNDPIPVLPIQRLPRPRLWQWLLMLAHYAGDPITSWVHNSSLFIMRQLSLPDETSPLYASDPCHPWSCHPCDPSMTSSFLNSHPWLESSCEPVSVNACIWLLQHHDQLPYVRPIQSVHCPLVVTITMLPPLPVNHSTERIVF